MSVVGYYQETVLGSSLLPWNWNLMVVVGVAEQGEKILSKLKVSSVHKSGNGWGPKLLFRNKSLTKSCICLRPNWHICWGSNSKSVEKLRKHEVEPTAAPPSQLKASAAKRRGLGLQGDNWGLEVHQVIFVLARWLMTRIVRDVIVSGRSAN